MKLFLESESKEMRDCGFDKRIFYKFFLNFDIISWSFEEKLGK